MIKFFQKCETCKKRKFIIKRRGIVMPIGGVALSQKLMCRNCQKIIQKAVDFNKNGRQRF